MYEHMVRARLADKRNAASREQSEPGGESLPGAPGGELSVRAVNVLKELAPELIGQDPPKGAWVPPDDLLQRLTARHLATARNCGPQTAREIISWARGR